jgi:hypothetical protein
VPSVKLLLFAAAAVAITASGPAMAQNWRQRQDSSVYSRCDLVRRLCAERHWKKPITAAFLDADVKFAVPGWVDSAFTIGGGVPRHMLAKKRKGKAKPGWLQGRALPLHPKQLTFRSIIQMSAFVMGRKNACMERADHPPIMLPHHLGARRGSCRNLGTYKRGRRKQPRGVSRKTCH